MGVIILPHDSYKNNGDGMKRKDKGWHWNCSLECFTPLSVNDVIPVLSLQEGKKTLEHFPDKQLQIECKTEANV